jgi:K+-transporting ATPase KdpF subunit
MLGLIVSGLVTVFLLVYLVYTLEMPDRNRTKGA